MAEHLEDLITQAEAARLRGVSRAAIAELIARGRLTGVPLLGKVWVKRSEILAFEKDKPGPREKRGAGTEGRKLGRPSKKANKDKNK
jgi:hypothetical protein